MKDDKIILQQMLQFIQKIEEYTSGIDFERFSENYQLQDAVIRNIELIGEATNRLSEEFITSHQEFPHTEAVSMRNKLIHGYDDLDLEIIWTTAKQDIQNLKSKVLALLQ